MKKLIYLVITILSLLIVSGCGLTKDDIYIVYTADTHSYLTENMNFANVKSYRDSLKKEHKYVSLIDGGDFTEGGNVGTKSKGSEIIELMNITGYDYAILGNHEFDFGLDVLNENIKNAKFEFLGCNILSNVLTTPKPYIIKKYGQTKVAYIGVSTSNTANKGSEAYNYIFDENNNPIVDFYGNPNDPDDNGERLCNKIQETINEVRSKVEYVVIISHLGTNDNPILSSYDLVKYTNGIDLVLDAHSHRSYIETQTNLDGKEIPMFAIGCHFEKIGQIKIGADGTIEMNYIENYPDKDTTVQNKIDELINKYD